MPTLDAIAETGLLSSSASGITRQFVPFSEELTAQCLASQLNSGAITLEEAYNSIWSYLDIGNERKHIPAHERIVPSVMRQTQNPERFTLELAAIDPYLAAKCAGEESGLSKQVKQQILMQVVRKIKNAVGLDYLDLILAIRSIDPDLERFIPFDETNFLRYWEILDKTRKNHPDMFERADPDKERELPDAPIVSAMLSLDRAPEVVRIPFEMYTLIENKQESCFYVAIDDGYHPTTGASAIVQFAQKFPLRINSYEKPSESIAKPTSLMELLMHLIDLGPIVKMSLRVPNETQKQALNDLLNDLRGNYFRPSMHTIYVTHEVCVDTPQKMFKLGLEMAKVPGLKESLATMRLLSYAGIKEDIPAINEAMQTATPQARVYLNYAIQLIKKKYEPKGYSSCQH